MEHLLLCYQADHNNRISIATRTLSSYISSRLDKDRYKISLLDFKTEENLEQMHQKILATDADIVGFSCYLWNFKNSFELSTLVKKSRPETKILMGGPQVNFDKEDLQDTFKSYPEIDLIIQGEGEISLLKYLQTPKAERPGKNAVIQGEPLGDMRELGSPIFGEHPPLWDSKAELPIELSRRCVGLCSFCVQACKTRFKQHHKSLEQFEKELLWAKDYGVQIMNFCDAHINVNSLPVNEIVDKILKADMGQVEHHFQLMYNILKEEDVEQLGRINTFTNLGLQSTKTEVNKLCKRALNLKRFERAISLFNKYKIKTQGHLIIGLPGDTIDGFRQSMEYANSLDVKLFDMFVFRVLPGTEFYYRRHQLGLEYDPDTYMIKKTNTMSADDILECIDIASQTSPDDWEMFDRSYLGIKSRKMSGPHIADEDRTDIDPPEDIEKLVTKPKPEKAAIKPLLLQAKRAISSMPNSESVKFSVQYFADEWAVVGEVTLDRKDVCKLAFLSANSVQSAFIENSNFKLVHLVDNSSKTNKNIEAYLRLMERSYGNKK